MSDPAETLPRSHLLSYLAAAESPTRVRKISAIATCCFSAGYFIATIITLLGLFLDTRDWLTTSGSAATMKDILNHMLRNSDSQVMLLFAFAFIAPGVLALCAARPVYRARPWACYLAMILALPWIPLLALAFGTCTFGGIAAFFTRELSFYATLLIIPGLLALLILMLTLDFLGFLIWIARHPITEKPPVPFLPPVTAAKPASARTPKHE